MEFGIGIAAAALAGTAVGAAWYGAFGRAWARAAGLEGSGLRPRPGVYALALVANAAMAGVLALVSGLLAGTPGPGPLSGLLAAMLLWAGLVATVLSVGHRFQGAPWRLTLIDGGHWLAVMIVQGLVIGAFA